MVRIVHFLVRGLRSYRGERLQGLQGYFLGRRQVVQIGA